LELIPNPEKLFKIEPEPISKGSLKLEELEEKKLAKLREREMLEREEMINFAMTVTGIMEYDVVKEALLRIFKEQRIDEKSVHKNCQKILDTCEVIQTEKIVAEIEKQENNDRPKKPEIDTTPQKIEEIKEILKSNEKSGNHNQYIINAKGEKIIAPGPNKKCHCGSGERYKKCCLNEDQKRMENLEKAKKQEETVIKSLQGLYI